MAYQQNAVSQQNIPVLVTELFGGNPTGDTVAYQVTATNAAAPTAFPYTATWYTDAQGRYWALCPAGPLSGYAPTAGTVKWLWIKITDSPEVPVLGPLLVQFA